MTTTHRRRRIAHIAGGLAIAGVTGWLLSGGIPDDGPAVPSVNLQGAPTAVITWQSIESFQLPISSQDGPRKITATQASGYSHTKTGAALAAAHLLIRTLPFVGPKTFDATIASQVVGSNTEALRRNTDYAYRDAAASAGITAPAPLPSSAGWMAGYRLDESASADAYTVRLLVRANEGDGAVTAEFAVRVEWHDGDWRVVAPDWGDWSTAVTTLSDVRPEEYLSFDDLGVTNAKAVALR